MQKIKKQHKNKPLTFLLILVFIFSPLVSTAPQKAEAIVVPVNDAIVSATNAAIAGFTGTLTAKETIGDTALYALMKPVISAFINQIQKKVLGSYNALVRDFEQELLDLQQQISDDLGIEITGLNTCNFLPTFNTDLSNSVKLSNRNNYNTKFAAKVDCNAGTVIPGGNIQDFYNNYNNGGPDAFAYIAFQPQNNPYGLQRIVDSELSARQEAEEKRELEELAWGSGIRPLKDATGLIETPAKVIETQLNEVLGSQTRSLENADEISEIVVAAVSSLITNKIMSSGVF